jgi:HD-GYP domain-containing protein (c-di-GMP phosphodiesterase class II)
MCVRGKQVATQFDEYGITIYPKGSALEQVHHREREMSLIAAGDGTEVVHIRLQANASWAMGPIDGWTALENLYVLHGRLKWVTPTEEIVLRPGDSMTCKPIRRDLILVAEEDTEFLYISSQPWFHHFSEQTRKLMELCVSIEQKDGYTAQHCERIMDLSMMVGREMNLTQNELYALHFGSFLHDIGKIRVPDSILLKPGKLTDDEWAVMKRHSVYGREILEESGLPFLSEAGVIVEQHHERYNGTGYPHGLSGSEISVGAAIVAVVDSFDAMTTHRVYRPGMPIDDALQEISSHRGILYHPDVVDAFLAVSDRIKLDDSGDRRGVFV